MKVVLCCALALFCVLGIAQAQWGGGYSSYYPYQQSSGSGSGIGFIFLIFILILIIPFMNNNNNGLADNLVILNRTK